MGTTEPLPDGWVRCKSNSRPNCFYFFNRKTGSTQWESPNKTDKNQKARNSSEVGKPSKPDSSSKGRVPGEGRLKVSIKSKDVKKLKTPAQDRLQKLIVTNKTVAESITKLVDLKTTIPNDKRKQLVTHVTKQPHNVTKHTTNNVDSTKSNKQATESKNSIELSPKKHSARKHSAKEIEKTVSDEIPALFPKRNLAEERMKSLQTNLTGVDKNKEPKQNVDALRVFCNGFGMGDSFQSSSHLSDDIDEAMDWEPCDDSTYSFQQLESMVVEKLTDSAYIVPDTNVFLDSLAAIKRISEQDHKYSILIPFVVLQELDQLKRRRDENSVGLKSSRAIKYIYEQLKSKNPRVYGQKATEDKEHIIDVNSPDDKILNCCLQLKKQSKDVILVTNDINLCNKALLSDIEAITSKQCWEKF